MSLELIPSLRSIAEISAKEYLEAKKSNTDIESKKQACISAYSSLSITIMYTRDNNRDLSTSSFFGDFDRHDTNQLCQLHRAFRGTEMFEMLCNKDNGIPSIIEYPEATSGYLRSINSGESYSPISGSGSEESWLPVLREISATNYNSWYTGEWKPVTVSHVTTHSDVISGSQILSMVDISPVANLTDELSWNEFTIDGVSTLVASSCIATVYMIDLVNSGVTLTGLNGIIPPTIEYNGKIYALSHLRGMNKFIPDDRRDYGNDEHTKVIQAHRDAGIPVPSNPGTSWTWVMEPYL